MHPFKMWQMGTHPYPSKQVGKQVSKIKLDETGNSVDYNFGRSLERKRKLATCNKFISYNLLNSYNHQESQISFAYWLEHNKCF